ncbi:hypothetical protein OKE68_11830 [Riemerella anatipestifer]|uniref:Transmembrane Fragile-X-F protein n=1 Tax=Riemerella anatipestifer TaxID=34085 RepID=A0AAP3ANL8_RIEAN|nr:hypothetical protein [Riemerella anatipestifer]MBT0572471.1 hypothetical protein [Riemerella anatipestifer]MBT0573688.1 hypothetical protein [Riemerella anatipestifer]MCU7568674.1 hypothetical protein [Riemerella anatipestifer]MCW0491264.1 hypothetical protein [Riemerella anatipestifer]MCW0524992.1 hypothetical protein [Riemerella anatipestifer]
METATNKSVGFISLLTLLFITLKLTKHIDWSWWLVLSPMLILFGLGIIIVLAVIFISKSKNRR